MNSKNAYCINFLQVSYSVIKEGERKKSKILSVVLTSDSDSSKKSSPNEKNSG